MPDFKKMTLEQLRALAGKALGPARARSKTKKELIAALEEAQGAAPPRPTRSAKAAGARVARSGTKASRGAAKPKAAASARRPAGQGARRGGASTPAPRSPELGPDPEGFFVARVRGEGAVREAPHALGEGAAGGEAAARALAEAGPGPVGPYDEGLGDLPATYGEDALVALARDPRTAFLYWEHTTATREAAFRGLETPRAQLWVFTRAGDGWERIRAVDFALEARGYYVHDLEPGRTYRAEIHLLDRAGRDRLLGRSSNEVQLPPAGPSPVVDDRFARIPFDAPMGEGVGPGRPGGPFPDEARARLAGLSDWSRFRTSVGSAGEEGERPGSPTSPRGPFGGRDR
jgi:hypothetical protein